MDVRLFRSSVEVQPAADAALIITSGLPGDSGVQVHVLPDAVYVKLVREQSFAAWAISQALPSNGSFSDSKLPSDC
ncbi:MAG: hypothetical protein ACI8XO_002843 [Verrucomicrobiales bacterium]|jgi:hypothetical protein